jgi:hypothetical protein
MRIGIPLFPTRISLRMAWNPQNSQIPLCQQVERRELRIVCDYLEVVEEDGGLEQGGGTEPGRDGEAGLSRDRQPRGGHGLVPGAGARERRHMAIRRGQHIWRTPSEGGVVLRARVWRIGHWRELWRGLSEGTRGREMEEGMV